MLETQRTLSSLKQPRLGGSTSHLAVLNILEVHVIHGQDLISLLQPGPMGVRIRDHLAQEKGGISHKVENCQVAFFFPQLGTKSQWIVDFTVQNLGEWGARGQPMGIVPLAQERI